MAAEHQKPGNHPRNREKRIVPHPSVCRARAMGGVQSFGACLVDNPTDCPYSLPAIGGNFCTHPNWKGFVKENDSV
jgi:hypothetical protein